MVVGERPAVHALCVEAATRVILARFSAFLQQSGEVDKDIHYADLQPLPAARWPSGSPGAERSEYASIRGAAK